MRVKATSTRHMKSTILDNIEFVVITETGAAVVSNFGTITKFDSSYVIVAYDWATE